MPLDIKAFTKLPVVASAKSPSPGKALASYAVLFAGFSSAEEAQASPIGGRIASFGGQTLALPSNAASEPPTAVFA